MKNDKNIPQHVAIIMDGNGRWAQERGLPRVAGHRAGVQTVREIVKAAAEEGVRYLTLYAFSQENWKRPKEEIDVLMELLDFFIDKEINAFVKEGIRLRTIGRIDALPPHTLMKLNDAIKKTEGNSRLVLNIALNYGSRTEILDAVRKIVEDAKTGTNGAGNLNEESFSHYLYTAGIPDPDLLIRTSGEMRLSNFLLWQLSYSEIYITKKYWPDFKKADFLKALQEYARRDRRFGDVQR